MKKMILLVGLLTFCFAALPNLCLAASPPAMLTYQGVLRDSAGAPQPDGGYDMIFRFYDTDGGAPPCPASGGTLLLTDSHLAAGTGAVTVTGGLFNAALGEGAVAAGAAGTLPEVFRDYGTVHLEVQVAQEILCPRVRMGSAGYALNTNHFDGRDAASFLDTSATEQTKFGPLTVTATTGYGVRGEGPTGGGYFLDSDGTSYAIVGTANFGINSSGNSTGGFFSDSDDSGTAYIAFGDQGISAGGNLKGGYFTDLDSSGEASVGFGNIGIQATGDQAGGYFNTVGIGTSSPSVALEVAGNARVTGDFEVDTLMRLAPGAMGLEFPDGSLQTRSAIGDLCTELTGTSACDPLSAIRGVVFVNWVTTLDSTGDVGRYTAIAIGTDGNPVISYYDGTNEDLKVAKCNDSACAYPPMVLTLDGIGAVGQWTSITIGTDGNPVISYLDDTNHEIKVAKCNDSACASPPTLSTLDSVGATSGWTSIAIGTDGNPVISYYDWTNQDLEVAKCSDSACATPPTLSTLDSTGDVGRYTAIAIGTDGNPVISYLGSNADLKVAKCNDSACATPPTLSTLDSSGNFALWTSIAIGTDGNPVISYHDWTNEDLKVAKCNDSACATPPTLSTLDSSGNVGVSTAIAIGTDGNPVISYSDGTNHDLKLAKCNDSACATPPTLLTLDSAGDVGSSTSIAIGTDGNPVISYHDWRNEDLKVIAHVDIPEGGSSRTAGFSTPGDFSAVQVDREDNGQVLVTGVYLAGLARSAYANPWGVGDRELPIDDEGNVYARSFRSKATGLASLVRVVEPVEAGDVLAIDPERPGFMSLAGVAADTAVFGIVAAEPGVLLGAGRPHGQGDNAEPSEADGFLAAEEVSAAASRRVPVAVSGVALCKVDAVYGSIRPGDLLTTSHTPGHAMRASDPLPGTILGKALEPLDTGTGLIKVLVMLR